MGDNKLTAMNELSSATAGHGDPKSDHDAIITTEVKAREESSVAASLESEKKPSTHLTGWRLHMTSFSGALCVFLVHLEVSVIGTSLLAITDDLRGFDRQSWIVTGYLTTYTGMIIIWAKSSDIFGRKAVLVFATILFTIFSGACGAAQTMNQLIVFRVLQGFGAAGSLAVALAICYEMVPPEKYQLQAVQYTGAIALGSLIGPLIGGAVSERSTWRWVFLLNVPAGAIVVALLMFVFPANFPYHNDPNYKPPTIKELWSRKTLGRLDISGAFLLLSGTMLLVTVLLEGGTSFSWNSGAAIALWIVAGLLWIAFLVNERFVTKDKSRIEPVFLWRFFSQRTWLGVLTLCFCSGIPFNVLIITIPQRFQAVDNISPFMAGVRLIPFNFSVSFGSVMANALAERFGVIPICNMLIGTVLQLIGIALFSTLPDTGGVPNAIYGYMVLVGLGAGFVIGICLVLPPQTVEPRDIPIASGALFQFRNLGGAIGLAIATAAMNSYTSDNLSDFLSGEQRAVLQQSTSEIMRFSPEMRERIQSVFAQGYNLQMRIMIGIAAAQVISVGLLWRNPQIRLVTKRSKQKELMEKQKREPQSLE